MTRREGDRDRIAQVGFGQFRYERYCEHIRAARACERRDARLRAWWHRAVAEAWRSAEEGDGMDPYAKPERPDDLELIIYGIYAAVAVLIVIGVAMVVRRWI